MSVYNYDNSLVELYTLNFNTLAMTLVGEMEDYVESIAFDLQSDELFGFYYEEMYRIIKNIGSSGLKTIQYASYNDKSVAVKKS